MHSSISDALELYIRLKGAGRDRVFAKTSARNVGYLIESIGDVDLSSIKTVNAGRFRDHLIAKGLASTSIRRVLSSVKAIYNLASKELGIANPNPFSGIFIPEDNAPGERLPVPHITLRKHPGRHLKTASSETDIPLVGSAYE